MFQGQWAGKEVKNEGPKVYSWQLELCQKCLVTFGPCHISLNLKISFRRFFYHVEFSDYSTTWILWFANWMFLNESLGYLFQFSIGLENHTKIGKIVKHFESIPKHVSSIFKKQEFFAWIKNMTYFWWKNEIMDCLDWSAKYSNLLCLHFNPMRNDNWTNL